MIYKKNSFDSTDYLQKENSFDSIDDLQEIQNVDNLQNADDLNDFVNQTFESDSNAITIAQRDYTEYSEIKSEEIDVPPYSVFFLGFREQKMVPYKAVTLFRELETVGYPFDASN